MNEQEYEKFKGEIETVLKEQGCYAYNTETDEFLEGIFPIALDLENYDDEEAVAIISAASYCGEIDLSAPWWTDDKGKAHVIKELFGLYYVLNTLVWEGLLEKCKFLVKGDSEYDALLSLPRDSEFINKLLEDYE